MKRFMRTAAFLAASSCFLAGVQFRAEAPRAEADGPQAPYGATGTEPDGTLARAADISQGRTDRHRDSGGTKDTPDSLLIVFWNIENFFDYRSVAKPQKYWTSRRFYRKCEDISRTLMRIADSYGRMPDAVGFAEVENRFAVQQIISSTLLRKLDYKVLHCDSPDRRGIDCALIYRSSTLTLRNWSSVHILDSNGTVIPTRDILVAEFDSLAVLVNHHPSQIGGKTEPRRKAMQTMYGIMDSLAAAGHGRIISVGDFNEARWTPQPLGTIRYNGVWEKIDGVFSIGGASIREEVFADASLLTEDRTFGGLKPLRTFSGPRYLGGISDHLPIVVVMNY